MQVEGQDIVACVAVAGCVLLISQGHDGGVIALFSTVIGYYFGRKGSKKDA